MGLGRNGIGKYDLNLLLQDWLTQELYFSRCYGSVWAFVSKAHRHFSGVSNL